MTHAADHPKSRDANGIICSLAYYIESLPSAFSVANIARDLMHAKQLDKFTSSSPIPIRKAKPIIGLELGDEIRTANSSPKEKGQRLTSDVVELFRDPKSPLTAQGTYFVKDRATGSKMGIFKPAAEEAAMQTRRRLSVSHVIKRGIVVGDAAIKERAAFLLDFDGFAGVPRTDFAVIDEGSDIEHFGSLQEFCEHMCTSEDLGPSKYDLENVHAIALLDLRLFNLDRHEGNLLVSQGDRPDIYKLIPIDHGFSLPSFRTLSDAMFCWTEWRQAKVPLSRRALDYVNQIAPINDIVALKRIGLRDECTMTYVLCSRYIQKCCEAGRTLYEMATSMQRDLNDDESISAFETLVQKSSYEADFNNFVFDDDTNTWTCEAVQKFLDTFDRNVALACRNPDCRLNSSDSNLIPELSLDPKSD